MRKRGTPTPRLAVRDARGGTIELETFSATQAKSSFGEVLDRAMAKGIVAITRRDRPRAVVLSIEEYEALTARFEDPLESLRAEFDALVERMQTSQAQAAGKGLFGGPSPARYWRSRREHEENCVQARPSP